MLTKQQMAALLGRPLTPSEDTNFTSYLDNAIDTLEYLLCASIRPSSVGVERVYDSRKEFSTVFTDFFTAPTLVKVDGNATTEYSARQWDNRNASWFNSVVLDCAPKGKEVAITATWGFTTLPNDLALLLARVFALNGESGGSGNIQSKKIEDFSITLADKTEFQGFLDDNATTLNKYSMCKTKSDVQNGDVCGYWRW